MEKAKHTPGPWTLMSGNTSHQFPGSDGMTLLDYLAAAALPPIIAAVYADKKCGLRAGEMPAFCADTAYEIGRAMLVARKA